MLIPDLETVFFYKYARSTFEAHDLEFFQVTFCICLDVNEIKVIVKQDINIASLHLKGLKPSFVFCAPSLNITSFPHENDKCSGDCLKK